VGFVDGDSLADMWIEVVWLSGVMVGRKLINGAEENK
jgi:hypothetical protein